MTGAIPSEQVRAETLFKVLLLREIIGVGQDGRPLTIHEVCAEAGIGVSTYYKHRQDNSEEWQEARAAADELCRHDELIGAAKRRLMRLLDSGQDGPAAQLIIRLLELAEHTKTDVEGNLQAMVEKLCGSHKPTELAAIAGLAAACDVGPGEASADSSETG